jgi:hypothetical protein
MAHCLKLFLNRMAFLRVASFFTLVASKTDASKITGDVIIFWYIAPLMRFQTEYAPNKRVIDVCIHSDSGEHEHD